MHADKTPGEKSKTVGTVMIESSINISDKYTPSANNSIRNHTSKITTAAARNTDKSVHPNIAENIKIPPRPKYERFETSTQVPFLLLQLYGTKKTIPLVWAETGNQKEKPVSRSFSILAFSCGTFCPLEASAVSAAVLRYSDAGIVSSHNPSASMQTGKDSCLLQEKGCNNARLLSCDDPACYLRLCGQTPDLQKTY